MTSFIMICCGLAIICVWTADILRADKIETKNGIQKARDPENISLMWPHWIAEYSTAFALLVGGIGLIAEKVWAFYLSLIALGALAYTSISSISWAFAKRERRNYAAAMLISLTGVIVTLIFLLQLNIPHKWNSFNPVGFHTVCPR